MGISVLFNKLPAETKTFCHESLAEAVRPAERSNKSSLYNQYNTLYDEWDFSYLDVQSEPTATDNTSTENVQAETLTFRDGALSERITMGDMSAGDYDADDDAIGGLSNFLSRPVRIHNFTWQESTFYNAGINPWHLYFNTAQIKKKLDNYGRIRCRLHLKFVLNASPFYFGSLRACYFPLPDQRSTYNSVVDQVPFSQVPGVYLEPQNMSTAEMVLPFLYPNNWLDATTAADFVNMGYLYFLQYANLRSANGVSGSGINISVYAWAEDVEVMGPTGTLAIQSQDEYSEEGVISGPATAVANIASKLTDVPVVGTFARATEVGAKAVAGIAKMFGYSNPPMINDVLPYQPKAFHAFANVETRVPLDKLSIDPKNEVTISSKVTGIDEPDPLAFNNYLTHESFLLGTLWSGSTAVDTLLWSAMVNPGYSRNLATVYTTTPAAYVSQMFRYWRGAMIYKFRIIKTQYHKGRLIISWDPTGNNTINADTETTTLTRIVDLELEDEVEFVVPYKATTPYLKTITTGGEAFSSNGPTPAYTLPNKQFCNGAITVRVQNVLTGPAASPSIDILGYVRCAEDFQFAVPIDVSTFWTTSDPTGVIQSEPEESAIDGKKHNVDAQMAAITFGESYASLRPILHRTSLSTTQTLGRFTTTGVAPVNYVGTTNFYYRFPEGYGRNFHGYSRGTIGGSTVPWSTSTNHPIDWILNSFVGVRGSSNVQFDIHSNGFTIDNINASRYYQTPIQATYQNRNALTTSLSVSNPGQLSNDAVFSNSFLTGQNGASVTNMRTQSALSVSYPQYTNSRFTLAFRNVRYNNIVTNVEEYDIIALRATIFNSNAVLADTSPWPVVDVYYGAGVDFQPIMFLCTPRMFVNITPTAFPLP